MISPRVVAVLALLCAAACARPSCPPPKLAGTSDPRPFLWEVQGPTANVILFGIFHGGGRADVPRAAITRLRGARVYVTEIPALDPDKVRPLMELPRGESLPELVGADAWWDLREALRAVIGEEELRRARPWYAMSLLTAVSSDLPSPTMDEALSAEAGSAGARLEYLETADEQLAALAESVDAADLKQALAERRQMRCVISDLAAAYRRGDGATIRADLTGEDATILLDERNRSWLPKIEGYLKGDGAFIAVGVSHLVGDGALPALLEARGHRVTRLAGP